MPKHRLQQVRPNRRRGSRWSRTIDRPLDRRAAEEFVEFSRIVAERREISVRSLFQEPHRVQDKAILERKEPSCPWVDSCCRILQQSSWFPCRDSKSSKYDPQCHWVSYIPDVPKTCVVGACHASIGRIVCLLPPALSHRGCTPAVHGIEHRNIAT